jgi:hypothetical protein
MTSFLPAPPPPHRLPPTRPQQQGGVPSQYVDPKYNPATQGAQFSPATVALQAQDPNHPANPAHPDVSRLPRGWTVVLGSC